MAFGLLFGICCEKPGSVQHPGVRWATVHSTAHLHAFLQLERHWLDDSGGALQSCIFSSPVWPIPCSGMTARKGALQEFWMQFTYISLDVYDYPWAIGLRFIYSEWKSIFWGSSLFIAMFSLHLVRQVPPTTLPPFQAPALTPSTYVSNVLSFALCSGCEKYS